jgi:biopolymer transport protein ExbD
VTQEHRPLSARFEAARRRRARTFTWALVVRGTQFFVLAGFVGATLYASRRGEEVAREASRERERSQPAPAHVVHLSREGISVDGKHLVSLEEVPEGDVTPQVFEALRPAAGNTHVVIRAEKEVQFRFVKRTMRTCAVAGFADIDFKMFEPP